MKGKRKRVLEPIITSKEKAERAIEIAKKKNNAIAILFLVSGPMKKAKTKKSSVRTPPVIKQDW